MRITNTILDTENKIILGKYSQFHTQDGFSCGVFVMKVQEIVS